MWYSEQQEIMLGQASIRGSVSGVPIRPQAFHGLNKHSSNQLLLMVWVLWLFVFGDYNYVISPEWAVLHLRLLPSKNTLLQMPYKQISSSLLLIWMYLLSLTLFLSIKEVWFAKEIYLYWVEIWYLIIHLKQIWFLYSFIKRKGHLVVHNLVTYMVIDYQWNSKDNRKRKLEIIWALLHALWLNTKLK